MKAYLDLLSEIMTRGTMKAQRATLASTGTRPRMKSIFGMQARYDLNGGFPLVTTKRVPYAQVVGELLWYLSGSTNNNDLLGYQVKVWNEWADQETGDLGPIYGKQWRRWETASGQTFDQVQRLLEDIRAVIDNPEHSAGRRLIITAWNPPEMGISKAPTACHTLVQFNVTEGKLSCQLYQRSADMFLGVPWNIACYATLTHLLAKITGLKVGEFVHTLGDAHIYENHFDQVNEQLGRTPRPLPRLELDDAITSIDGLRVDQFKLVGYDPHPGLRGEVAV